MAYTNEYYQQNKDSLAAAKRRYYLKKKEDRLAYQKQYDDSHREIIRSRKQKCSKTEPNEMTPEDVECELKNN